MTDEQVKALAGSHYSGDDCWYSCPLSEEGCCNDTVEKDVCNCGYDDRAKAITLALIAERRAVWLEAAKFFDALQDEQNPRTAGQLIFNFQEHCYQQAEAGR